MSIDEPALAALARSQHGAFTHEQARALGASRSSIETALRSGRWIRPIRGVSVLAGTPPSLAQRSMVATLARPGSATTLLTAGHLHGWIDASPHLPHLVVPRSATSRSPIATIHRSDVAPNDIVLVQAIPTTDAERTLVDLSRTLGPQRLARILDRALHRRATSTRAVEAHLGDRTDVSEAQRRQLVDILEAWDGPILPGSAGEVRLFRLIESWGFPRPERQIEIRDHDGHVVARADGGWTVRRIALEYDSLEFHGPLRWAADEARHALVTSLGWQMLHADKTDLRPGERSFRDQLARAWATSEHLVPSPGLLHPGA